MDVAVLTALLFGSLLFFLALGLPIAFCFGGIAPSPVYPGHYSLQFMD